MSTRIVVAAICVAALGCKDKSAAPAKRDPAPAPATADASQAADAFVPPDAGAQDPRVISSRGVGPITDLVQGTRDDDAQRALLAKAVEPLGLTVEMDVMDLPGEVETEEGYFSVKQGDREVLQIFRGDEARPKMTVHIVDPFFATADGLKIGDTYATLLEKRKDVACNVDPKNELGLITCRSASDAGLTYVLDAEKFRGAKVDPARDAGRKIVDIVL